MPMLWFDAHLDLAYLAVNGRDMLAPLNRDARPHPPAAVTLPALADGNVRFILATIFTEAGGKGPEGYPAGDAERAHRVGRAQLEVYEAWRDRAHIALGFRAALRPDPGVGEIRAGLGASEVVAPPIERLVAREPRSPSLRAGILVECADPIGGPDELPWWVERGVVAVGLTWARGSRYAAGNAEPSCSSGVGLTDLGRDMVRRMDDLGVVHDASHLSDRALDGLFSLTDRPVIASHSNSRTLMGDGDQRHLTDAAIREIGRRGGVVGLNLARNFIRPGIRREDPQDRPSIDDAVRHVEHAAEIMGHRRGVGLGSDLDGGLTASDLPAGIEAPSDFIKIADALSARGWPDADTEAFAWKNWARFFAAR